MQLHLRQKLLLFITVLFFGISTINAQDASYGYEAGDWLLGGGVTFGSMDMGGVETKMNTIAPQVGYFLNENSALGLNLGLELENRYFSLIIAPQIVFPIISTGTYNYEKSGNTNIVSQKLSSKTGLSGYEVPVYFDLSNFFIGFIYL